MADRWAVSARYVVRRYFSTGEARHWTQPASLLVPAPHSLRTANFGAVSVPCARVVVHVYVLRRLCRTAVAVPPVIEPAIAASRRNGRGQ